MDWFLYRERMDVLIGMPMVQFMVQIEWVWVFYEKAYASILKGFYKDDSSSQID